LSIVLATDGFASIRHVAAQLVAQTVAADLELVVVCPSAAALGLPESGLDPLGAVRVVEHPLLPLGEARAAGVRAAVAPIVAIAETHAFPAPAWAEHLLEAHSRGWAVVMPSVANANPHRALSWSSYLIDYGAWAPGGRAREIQHPPQYHTAVRTALLLELDDRLAELVTPGSTLADELRSRGHRFYHEPRARIEHLNLARRRAWAEERFLGGRLLGAARRDRWPLARTIVYAAGSPLIPFVRFVRTRPALQRAARAGVLPRGTRSAIVLACVVWAAGEVVGYLAGRGNAEARMLEYELHKDRYVDRGGPASATA
jgi:hypothetical protein